MSSNQEFTISVILIFAAIAVIFGFGYSLHDQNNKNAELFAKATEKTLECRMKFAETKSTDRLDLICGKPQTWRGFWNNN
jgi:hypothetical protein